MSNNATQEALKEQLVAAVLKSLFYICGGGLYLEGNEDETSSAVRDDDEWTAELEKVARTTISFPNKQSNVIDGKPHNVEIRCALALFHKCAGRKRKRRVNNATPPIVTAVSNLGVKRSVASPLELATLLCCHDLEESLRQAKLSHDVRPNASGIICLVTLKRAQLLREAGRLPCPQCVKWCKGEKGLWWHQQMEHGSEHSIATAAAASERNTLSMVLYDPQQHTIFKPTKTNSGPCCVLDDCPDESVFELARNGNIDGIKQVIKDGFDPRESLDGNGASLLLWAAGSGHLDIVVYLVETCDCSPHLGQKGKRSFSGRTPLHWSSRNGHLEVVKYLVEKCHVDIDATTADGTTAFCWASWQAHLSVMKFLYERGAHVEKSNSFGCNAVLWCAQGQGTVGTMKWLESISLNLFNTNSNGHGALHKAAQRKRRDVCEWLCVSIFAKLNASDIGTSVFDIIGPDTEGFCPSDLAGAGGDDELALFISKQEMKLTSLWRTQMLSAVGGHDNSYSQVKLPKWLQEEDSLVSLIMNESELNVWGPFGGVRRVQWRLRNV